MVDSAKSLLLIFFIAVYRITSLMKLTCRELLLVKKASRKPMGSSAKLTRKKIA
jgi:hypothetical protein